MTPHRSSPTERKVCELEATVSIRVNGAHRRVPGGISVADLTLELGLEPAKVAVERNLEIVPRSTLAEVAVEEGDAYEIVTFVGGG
jgi:thiamine biosynthesis protein ThiS